MRRIQVFRDRAALEAVQAGEDAEPRLLHDLLRDRPARDVAERDPQHQRAVAVHERHERVLVPRPQAGEEVGVVHPRRVTRLRGDGGLARNPDRRARGRRRVHAPGALAALARPAGARRSPDRDDRADLDPGAPDVLVLVATLRTRPRPARSRPSRCGSPSPSRAARPRRCGRRPRAAPAHWDDDDRYRDEDDDDRPPGLWSGWAAASLRSAGDRNGWLDHSSESVTKRERCAT